MSEHPAAPMKRAQTLFGLVLVAIIVVALAVVLTSPSSRKKQPGEKIFAQNLTRKELAGVEQHGMTMGSPSAPVTIVEIGDMQCPVCADFAKKSVPKVIRRLVRTGKAKYQLRLSTAIGDDSKPLGRLVLAAAQQNRAFDVANLIFRNQDTENSGYATQGFQRRVLSGVAGLDAARVLSARDSGPIEGQLRADGDFVHALDVKATPTLFVAAGGGKPKKIGAGVVSVGDIANAVDDAAAGKSR